LTENFFFATMEKMRKNSGQALLIILLVMAVGLTIGLAVISRSVTDVGISRQEEESARVFSVAEAGIEEALRSGAVPPGGVVEIGGIRATVTKSNLGKASDFVFPGEYAAGDIQTLWLVEHDANGNLDTSSRYSANSIEVYWGKEGGITSVPALEATLIYEQSGVKIMRWALDPDIGRNNGFDTAISPGTQLGGKNFRYKKSLSLPCSQRGVICYALRLRLLYNTEEEILGAKAPSGTIPSQGVCFESTASPQGGGVTRRVRQCQLYKSPPGIFDYVLYSEQNLSKN
jgi:hypothetical protein